MPGQFPLYSAPPVSFRDNRIVIVVFKTAPEVLRELVPEPLFPNPLNLMFAYIAASTSRIPSPGGSAISRRESASRHFSQDDGSGKLCRLPVSRRGDAHQRGKGGLGMAQKGREAHAC